MKKLSKKDRIILTVAGVALAIALCCQGWYYWPWIGGNVVCIHPYDWTLYSPQDISSPSDPSAYSITNYTHYSKRQLLKYFHDIVLRREYDGTVHTCAKWVSPIRLCVINIPGPKELEIINNVLLFLNNIPGFPGITLTNTVDDANITLTFYDDSHFIKGIYAYFNILSQDDNDNLTGIEIFVRSTLDPNLMSSVLWEELLQATGPMNDTALTDDTLFTSTSTEITQASNLDRTILEMLYCPAIRSGMNYVHCLPIFLEYLK